MRRAAAIAAVVRRRARGGARRSARPTATAATARPTRSCSTTPSASPTAATSRSPASAPARPASCSSRARRRPLAVVEAEVTEPGFADLRSDARCEIRPQSFIGEYFVDCQPGTSPRRLPDGGRVPVEQTSSTIRARPGQQHPAPALPRPAAPDRRRARRRPRRAPEDLNDVIRRAHPGPARDQRDAAHPRPPDQDDRSAHRRRRPRDRRARGAQARRHALRPRGRPNGRDRLDPARGAGRDLPAAARLPGRAASPTWAGSATSPSAQKPVLRDLGAALRASWTRFLTRLRPFAPRPAPRPSSRSASASVVGRRAVHESERGDPRAAQAGERRPRAGQAAAPVPADDRRPQAAPSSPTRARPPPTRPRPTRRTSRAAAAASPAWRRSGTTSTGRR